MMTLEIGKTYRTRDGQLHVLVEAETTIRGTYAMRGMDDQGRVTWRSAKGRFGRHPHALDLVGVGANQIKRAYIRHYSDSGQTNAYVEWSDGSRTEGDYPLGTHMTELFKRAKREGITVTRESW